LVVFLFDLLRLTLLLLLSLLHRLKLLLLTLARALTVVGNVFLWNLEGLNGQHEVDGKLSVLPKCLVPVRWDAIAESDHTCDTTNQELAHWRVLVRVRVDVLYAPETRVCLRVPVEAPDSFEDIPDKHSDLPLFRP